jgi:hypothetical protein
MKFLCLAYGAEKDWKALAKAEQDTLLAQDEALRKKGALMGAVEPKVTTVRAWNGSVEIAAEPFSELKAPLAGFSIIDADSLDEIINMVAKTPCARARGAIEVRPIMMMNEEQWKLSDDCQNHE